MEAPNPNKRLRIVPSISFSSSGQIQKPNPNVPDLNKNHVDQIISSLLSLPDLSSLSIGCSFDRALEKQLSEASGDDDSVLDRLTDSSLELFSLLHESAKRCSRKRASIRNSNSWPLPHELTIKVFSTLDTKSLMQVMACCTMFNKCAMNPLCYSHIDLTTGDVDDKVVHSMIHHADKELRSLKLGRIPCPDESTPSLLTKYCLTPLYLNQDFSGNLLRSLHLYHCISLDPESLCFVLSACLNLIDLKIVVCFGDDRDMSFPLDKVLELLPRTCQHLFIEKEIKSADSSYLYTTTPFWRNCPDLTSLSLIGFAINDLQASLLIKGFRKLKNLNLSRNVGILGRFFSADWGDTLLETLIFRDCICLEEEKVLWIFDSLLKGNFRFIQHIDISSKHGLMSRSMRYCKPKFCLEKLRKGRPSLTFVADFTSDSSSLSFGDASPSGSLTEENDWW